MAAFRHKSNAAIPCYILTNYLAVLIAFKIASTQTPTSAKTAAHIVAIPTAANTRTATFTTNAK